MNRGPVRRGRRLVLRVLVLLGAQVLQRVLHVGEALLQERLDLLQPGDLPGDIVSAVVAVMAPPAAKTAAAPPAAELRVVPFAFGVRLRPAPAAEAGTRPAPTVEAGTGSAPARSEAVPKRAVPAAEHPRAEAEPPTAPERP